MSRPEVSVVMAVFNAAASLPATLDSVLGQTGCELEFVVVNDGSTDDSGAVLDTRAVRDPRLRVLHQANQGLTRSLVRGCAEARGEFIARQDADDRSLPGRLAAQLARLRADPRLAAVATGLRFAAPHGEWVQDVLPPARIDPDISGESVALPPLVAACFRRDAYERCGGFEPTFVVAQDIDLWLRLIEQGPCEGMPEVLYEAVLTPGGISSRRRPEQLRHAALALACARARRAGLDEAPLLDAFVPAPRVSRNTSPRQRARERAAFHYFVASCLRPHDRDAARRYFAQALSDNPLHFKALVRRVLT